MSEKQAKKTKTLVDPFTGVTKEVPIFAEEPKQGDPNLLDQLGVELDKETGNTVVVVTGTRDIDAEIQQFKDDCGFEGMAKLIAQGRATPRDFYDDGKHGQDVAGLPDNVHDAYRASMEANSKSDALLKDLGIDVNDLKTQEAIEKAITEAVNKRFEALNKETNNAKTE